MRKQFNAPMGTIVQIDEAKVRDSRRGVRDLGI